MRSLAWTLVALVVLSACGGRRRGDDDDDVGADGDADSDGDGDGDVDGDADADADGDGDADGDADGDSALLTFTTSLGEFRVQLDAVNAPNTTANFLRYVDEGFYDGTVFHRVIPGFVIQGGGYDTERVAKATHAPIDDELSDALHHVDGAISMANAGPDTATSQFFVCDGPQLGLDGGYAAFGVTVEGIEVVREIAAVERDGNDWPLADVVLESVTRAP